MPKLTMSFALLIALLVGLGHMPDHAAQAHRNRTAPVFAPIGTYQTGLGEGSGETVAVDRKLMIVTNSVNNSLDFVDTSVAAAPQLLQRIDLSPYGAGPNSVAIRSNLVAVAVEANPKTDPGKVVLFDRSGRFLNQFTVGALPDMLTFSPDGRLLLVANEGEPNDDYSIDPEGSVSILPIWRGSRNMAQSKIITADFHSFEKGAKCEKDLDPATRIFGPSANRDTNPRAVSQNLEPEYISFSPDGRFAYVTLQEANAVGILDLSESEFIKVVALGTKAHSLPGNGFDASDRDNAINITNWPVHGMYQPDAIATFKTHGKTYLVTANEGDARDYAALREETTVGNASYILDPVAFPNAASLKNSAALGRLTVTKFGGDTDGDGDYDAIYAFGARSFTIWSDTGKLVWDSGDQFEQILAATYPANFNASNTSSAFDNRSDNKGPEPEGIAVGAIKGRTYAFVGLERIGGVMIYDITEPSAPQFIQYVNNRDFSMAAGPDSGPEVIIFVPGGRSPSGEPRFLVANEISGSVTIYEQIEQN
jgi:hypothetical protein